MYDFIFIKHLFLPQQATENNFILVLSDNIAVNFNEDNILLLNILYFCVMWIIYKCCK